MAADPLFGRMTLLFMLVVFTVSLTLLNSFSSKNELLSAPEHVLAGDSSVNAHSTIKETPSVAPGRPESPPKAPKKENQSSGQQIETEAQPTATAPAPMKTIEKPPMLRPTPVTPDTTPPIVEKAEPKVVDKTPSKDDTVLLKTNETEEEEEVEVEAPRLQSLSMNCYSGQCILYGKLTIILSIQKELAALCSSCFSWARQRPDANFPPIQGFDAKSVTFKPLQTSKTYADRAIRAILLDVILGVGFRVEELSMLPDEYEYIFVREAEQAVE